ncbi:diacylglycerol kinase family protein [Planctomicrobium sp. SH527]|uniref:diacylglycerol kinase family protein n=1 Tax=Planctomicrobium sp. SH527 TaxID=3448123 RepID=UPI003F5C0C4B
MVSPQGPVPFVRSLFFALRGLVEALREQRNIRVHLVTTIAVCTAAFILRLDAITCTILLLCIGLVVSTELLNTALETVVDLVSPEHHELARKAKDIAAGAVLFASLIAICIGITLIGPPLIRFVTSVMPIR